MAPSGPIDTPPTRRPPDDQSDRKRRVLKRSHASNVRSISDAVVIKDGDPFFLCPPDGQIPLDGQHGYGLYQHDTRFLEGYELRIVGVAPESLAATAAAGRTAILELTNPEIHLANGRSISKQRLAIRWTRTLDGARSELRDELEITNSDPDDVTLRLRVEIAAGFRDVFEIRGLLDGPSGARHGARWEGGRLIFAFDGKDEVKRSLSVAFDPAPQDRDGAIAEVDLALSGRGVGTLGITFQMHEEVAPGAAPIEGGPGHAPARGKRLVTTERATDADWIGGGTGTLGLRSNSHMFDAVVRRSLADLDLLRARLDDQPYYVAGLPWFSALFGRDSLIVGLQTLAFDPSVAAGTLRLLAGRQGDTTDEWRDEQPGKILHELRVGELARLDRIPQTPYFGSVDSTPLFLILLAEHAAWTGSLDLFHELRSHVERAVAWVDQAGEGEGDGFVVYDSTSDGGLANQGWKDSGDGIVEASGAIARPPIILAEVQGYVFLAKRGLADLFERDGDADRAAALRSEASELQERFEHDFWSDDLDCYVMALQKDRQPCSVISSNAGQVLFSGIASRKRAAAVERQLMSEAMFSGWGIRTLSTEAIAYNPVGYHLGTVWPHDNAIIAAGFRRYGHDDSASRILGSLVEAAADFEHARLPECFAGLERSVFGIPVRYPVACHPQAWAAGSMPHLLTETLGLRPAAFDRRLRIVRPSLPSFLDHLSIRGLTVGGGQVDLDFHRSRASIEVSVGPISGDLDVVIDDRPAPGRNEASP